MGLYRVYRGTCIFLLGRGSYNARSSRLTKLFQNSLDPGSGNTI